MGAKRWCTHRAAGFAAVVLSCLLGTPASGASPTSEELVGGSLLDFSLPSAQQRLVDYERDYYGRHHLVLTFFPAAFTPV